MLRRILIPLCGLALLTLAGCSQERPWARDDAPKTSAEPRPEPTPTPQPPAVVPPPPTAPATTPPTATSPSSTDGVPPSAVPATTALTPAEAARLAIKQDRQARLLLRTAVSVIESCHSGRDRFTACDNQFELGAPAKSGITVGYRVGTVQISATPNAYRLTARSASGNKFTVARSPRGERHRCIRKGKYPGACPSDGNWAW